MEGRMEGRGMIERGDAHYKTLPLLCIGSCQPISLKILLTHKPGFHLKNCWKSSSMLHFRLSQYTSNAFYTHLPALSCASALAPFSSSRTAILAMPSDEVIEGELVTPVEAEEADQGLHVETLLRSMKGATTDPMVIEFTEKSQ